MVEIGASLDDVEVALGRDLELFDECGGSIERISSDVVLYVMFDHGGDDRARELIRIDISDSLGSPWASPSPEDYDILDGEIVELADALRSVGYLPGLPLAEARPDLLGLVESVPNGPLGFAGGVEERVWLPSSDGKSALALTIVEGVIKYVRIGRIDLVEYFYLCA